MVLTESGDVYSFGTSSNGQLGLGTRILESAEPLKIASISGHHTVVGISCGENHTALVTQDGKLLTFGDGRHGKLCLDVETLTNHYTPVPSSRFRVRLPLSILRLFYPQCIKTVLKCLTFLIWMFFGSVFVKLRHSIHFEMASESEVTMF